MNEIRSLGPSLIYIRRDDGTLIFEGYATLRLNAPSEVVGAFRRSSLTHCDRYPTPFASAFQNDATRVAAIADRELAAWQDFLSGVKATPSIRRNEGASA